MNSLIRRSLLKNKNINLMGGMPLNRNFATLVLAEHYEGQLNTGSLASCLKAAEGFNDDKVNNINIIIII